MQYQTAHFYTFIRVLSLAQMAEETTCIEYLSQVTAETCMIVGFGLIPQPLTGVSKSCLISDIGMSVTEPIVGSVASILHAVQSADSRKGICSNLHNVTVLG